MTHVHEQPEADPPHRGKQKVGRPASPKVEISVTAHAPQLGQIVAAMLVASE